MMQRRKSTDVLLQTIDVKGKRIFDVGCGDGALSRLMAKSGAAKVIGIENNSRQLMKANAAEKTAHCTIIEGSALKLPGDNGSADVVVFFNSLHHLSAADQPKALKEAARVLKHGGCIYISEPVAEGPHYEAAKAIDDEAEIRKIAQDNIKASLQLGLAMEKEEIFIHTVRYRGFEGFRERIVSANPEREKKFREKDHDIRQLFSRLATPAGGEYCLDQPVKMNLLRKK